MNDSQLKFLNSFGFLPTNQTVEPNNEACHEALSQLSHLRGRV